MDRVEEHMLYATTQRDKDTFPKLYNTGVGKSVVWTRTLTSKTRRLLELEVSLYHSAENYDTTAMTAFRFLPSVVFFFPV